MPACCIVLTTDQTYLFPTLVSALQARRHASAEKTDVMIFGFGVDAVAERDFAQICTAEGIRFMAVADDLVEGANAMMSRLFLNRFVPPGYTQYLYIDGDVQITRSLDRLIEAEVPPGHFLAANDPMTFMLAEGGAQARDFAQHMEEIGLGASEAGAYFNTGVLRINRAGWDEIGQRAWAIVSRRGHRFRFPDQDPLNIATVGIRLPMSLAWNFPIFMRNARVEAEIRPAIYHFMSSPKPWHGAFPPWTAAAHAPYPEAVRRYPALAIYRPTMPLARQLRYQLQQRYKKALETVTWGFGERRQRILHYETQAMLA